MKNYDVRGPVTELSRLIVNLQRANELPHVTARIADAIASARAVRAVNAMAPLTHDEARAVYDNLRAYDIDASTGITAEANPFRAF